MRQQDEMWTETTTNGCNLLKCSQDGESEKLKIIKTPGKGHHTVILQLHL